MEWVRTVNHSHAEWKNAQFVAAMFSNLKCTETSFSLISPIWIRGSYSTHRCLELEIWRFSWWRQWQTTDKTDCFTPCACAQGNKLHTLSRTKFYGGFVSTWGHHFIWACIKARLLTRWIVDSRLWIKVMDKNVLLWWPLTICTCAFMVQC